MSNRTFVDKAAAWADNVIARYPLAASLGAGAATGTLLWGLIEAYQAYIRANELFGCLVVISGASSGIGAGCALEMARRGARKVVLLARREVDLQRRCAEINAAVGHDVATPYKCDCSKPDQVQEVRYVPSSRPSAETQAHPFLCSPGNLCSRKLFLTTALLFRASGHFHSASLIHTRCTSRVTGRSLSALSQLLNKTRCSAENAMHA